MAKDKSSGKEPTFETDTVEDALPGETPVAAESEGPLPGAIGVAQPGQAQPQFIVNGQYIKDLSFENPNILKMMQASAQQPEVNIDLGVNVNGVNEGGYEVTLQMRVETRRDGMTGFIIELSYAGLFTLTGWQNEQVEPLLFIEGPRLLFPFARQLVSAITQGGGYPPLNLNPIDFTELYRRRLAQQAATGVTGSSAVN
jgi:preprotein translocase subunit SecB